MELYRRQASNCITTIVVLLMLSGRRDSACVLLLQMLDAGVCTQAVEAALRCLQVGHYRVLSR